MSEYKRINVNIKDYYKTYDNYQRRRMKDDLPKGEVKIYKIKDGKNELITKSNLVVYMGREWLLSRALNIVNSDISPQPSQWISWFGLGDGGAPISNPLVPTAPENTDTSLVNDIMISETDPLCGDWRTTPVPGYYKCPFDSVRFEQDENNYDSYLIASITVEIGKDRANGYGLNEAGLFVASSSSGPFHIYARVTFPTFVKDSQTSLSFIWTLYF